MKELSIEEKARAYDNALEMAKKEMSKDGIKNDVIVCGVMKKVFPELTESEDKKTERILYSISSKMRLHLCDIFTEEEFQCFDTWSNAWLEKQNSKKHEEELEKAYKTADKVQYRRGYEAAMKEMEKQGEISPILSNSSNIGKDEQKPWSEKDEKEYKYVLKFVDNILNNCGNKKDY